MLLAGVGFLVALTATGAEGNENRLFSRPDGPFKKTISGEIQGKRQEAEEHPAAVPAVGRPIDVNLDIHRSALTRVE